MVLTLYKTDASPPVRSVLMVIESLGLSDVKYVDVNLFEAANLKDEYVKMNPQHTVPLLKDDDFCIWDSHAISVYLITKYGKDDTLYPKDPQKRAIIDQRLHFDSGIMFPALRGTVAPVFFRGVKSIQPENVAQINKTYGFAEKFLSTTWMAGDELTLADICCVSSLSSMNEVVPVDSAVYPNLSAWLERCSQEEFFKKGNGPGLGQFRAMLKLKLG